MEITHTWKIDRLDKINDGTGTVKVIAAYVLSTNGEVSVSAPTEVELNVNNIESFIDYINLTEDLVISWVKNELGDTNVRYLEEENEKFIVSQTKARSEMVLSVIPDLPPWETP